MNNEKITKDFKEILGNYPYQIGVGKSKNKKDILSSLWDNGSRLIDLGCSFPGKNTDLINTFIEDKEDIVLCQQLPLNDGGIFNKYGTHIYEMDEEQLKLVIDNIIQEQLSSNNVEFYHIYLIHSIFSTRFFDNIVDDINLYIRIFNILKSYKEKGIFQHLGFSASIDYNLLSTFIFKLQGTGLIEHIDVAMVSYNILSYNVNAIRQNYNIDIWDSPNVEGLRLLKDNNFTIICMTPFERGKVLEAIDKCPEMGYTLENITYDAYSYILNCKYIDYILIGTSSLNHLEEIYNTYKTFSAIKTMEGSR